MLFFSPKLKHRSLRLSVICYSYAATGGRSTMCPIVFLFCFVFICFQNVNNLLQACKELYNSKNFLLVLEYVLSVGNILNAGSNRGGAYRFKLQSLPKVTSDVHRPKLHESQEMFCIPQWCDNSDNSPPENWTPFNLGPKNASDNFPSLP